MYLCLNLVVVLLGASLLTPAVAMNAEEEKEKSRVREQRSWLLSLEDSREKAEMAEQLAQFRIMEEEEAQRREKETIKRQENDEELTRYMQEQIKRWENDKKHKEEEKVREKAERERRTQAALEEWKASVQNKQELEKQLAEVRSRAAAQYQAKKNVGIDVLSSCLGAVKGFFENCFNDMTTPSIEKKRKKQRDAYPRRTASSHIDPEDDSLLAIALLESQEHSTGALLTTPQDIEGETDPLLQIALQTSKEDEEKRNARELEKDRTLRAEQDLAYENALKRDQETERLKTQAPH